MDEIIDPEAAELAELERELAREEEERAAKAAATPGPAEAEAKGDGEAKAADKPRRGYATYTVKPVAALPENAKAETPPTEGRYMNLLEQIVAAPTDDNGMPQWYEVAHFSTWNGAQTVKKDLLKGERKIPDGRWEFEARRVDSGKVDEEGKKIRHSKLYARWLGASVPGDQVPEGKPESEPDSEGEAQPAA